MHSLAFRTSDVTSAHACLELIAHATTKARIRRIQGTLVTAAATVIGLGRPAAIGLTPTTPLTALPDDAGLPTGATTGATAWGTGPTIPTQFLRRVALPATIGANWLWEWDKNDELIIVPSFSVVLWNILGGATLDVNITIDEK